MANQGDSKAMPGDPRRIGIMADDQTYIKTFYGLRPWVKELEEFCQGYSAFKEISGSESAEFLKTIPVFEARYKGTDAVLRRLVEGGISQVLSSGAGMEPRGIDVVVDYPDVKYMESDISERFLQKSAIADEIFRKYGLPRRENLAFSIADIRDIGQMKKAAGLFSSSEKVAFVNEGVLGYYPISQI